MPKVKVLSAEKAFEAAHYGGPFDFNKENYIIISITDIRTEKSFVKVHLKPKNPQDRKAIENLLEGKN